MKDFQRLPLNTLKAFEASARLGSLRLAADELCVTHGAVSQQVKKLEAYLGVALFERQGRSISLTAQGQQLIQQLQPLLIRLAAMTRALEPQSLTGTLTIGCSNDTAVLWLAPALGDFYRQYPDIELILKEILPGEALPSEVDIAIINQLPESAGAQFKLLADQYFFPVANTDCPADTAFAQLPLLHADKGGLWSAWFREAGLAYPENRPHIYLPSAAAVISGAIAGTGIALAHRLEVQQALQQQRLMRLSQQQVKSAQAYFVASHGHQLPIKAELFLNWLQQSCQM